MRFEDIPKFFRPPHYNATTQWNHVERQLESWEERGTDTTWLELDPDFQRGHVWTEDKQIAYVEFCLRGGDSSRTILFNHPNWMDSFEGPMTLVDGKQRLEAVRKFIRNELPIFDGNLLNDFDDPKKVLRCSEAYFNFKVNNLKTRRELLQWYLQLNTGGVVHTDEEIANVHKLLEKEQLDIPIGICQVARMKTTYQLQRNGISLKAEISPCVWGHKGYPLQVRVYDPNDGMLGDTFLRDKSKNWDTATEADVRALLKTVKLSECVNDGCTNLRFIDPESNRAGQCEKCFCAKLDEEYQEAVKEEEAQLAKQDKQQYKKGMRYRVTAWIHGQGGDDQQVDIYFSKKPTPAMIRKQARSSQDDWTILKLAA